MIFSSILKIVEAALSSWEHKLKQKYVDQIEELKRTYYAEINKPDDERSDAVLDNLERELCIAAEALAAQIRVQNA